MSVETLEDLFVRLCRFGIALAFSCLILSVLVQVLGRTFGSSPVWTEELTRFALLYIAAFGAGLSLRSGDLVNVDIVCESLKGQWPWRLRLLSSILTAFLCVVLLLPAWDYVSIGRLQTSAAMGLRMDLIHASVLVLLLVLFVFSVLRIAGMILGSDQGLPDRKEQNS